MLKYLQSLHSLKPSIQLAQYLATLATPKEQTADLFIAGIKEFTRIANLSGNARTSFFGNSFGGVHYYKDLEKLFNNSFPTKTSSDRLFCLAPPDWEDVTTNGARILIYRGHKPSEALDKLLQGPTIIDCGMFCQLSIWFGIRYMLGNDRFNEVFSKTHVQITQYLYEKSSDPLKPYFNNPFNSFAATTRNEDPTAVDIVAIVNYPYYKAKHPAGAHQVHNCLLIGGMYTIFDPNEPKTTDLQASVIEALLLKLFNDPQNADDKRELAYYATQKSKIHPTLRVSYDELIMMAQERKNSTLDIDTWKNHEAFGNSKYTFRFDLVKFNEWLKSVPQNTTNPAQPSTTPRIIHPKYGNNHIYRVFDHKVTQVLVSVKAIKINEECADKKKLNLTEFYKPQPHP